MGTRSLIHIKDGKKTIVTIYRQFDGYPTGMGNDIKNILNKGKVDILNGFSNSCKAPKQFNGIGCLAPFLIGELKERKIGNVYIFAPNAKDVGEEYVYTLSVTPSGQLKMKVLNTWNNKIIFFDLLSKFDGEEVEALNRKLEAH